MIFTFLFENSKSSFSKENLTNIFLPQIYINGLYTLPFILLIYFKSLLFNSFQPI